MAVVVQNIKMHIEHNDADLAAMAAKKLGVNSTDIATLSVKRQSLDSRKNEAYYVYTLHVTLKDKEMQNRLEKSFEKPQEYSQQNIVYGRKPSGQVVVVGSGPCGLFAALTLAKHGYRPLLIERGKSMKERTKDVSLLSEKGILNTQSNICFGAGGAGAFSDGKLTTRIKDPRSELVIKTLASFGAPQEITYMAKPHTGTEYIRKAVLGIIKEIEKCGGKVEFECNLKSINSSNGTLKAIKYERNGLLTEIETSCVVLAIGHSARDTYEYLSKIGISMAAKPFAVGLRIEHLREFIDKAQYGEQHTRLGAAEYRLTSKQGGRGVYTFCMCPGGEVVNSSTEQAGIAVNGMSYYARNGNNSNSAVVVSVTPEDFDGTVLGGIEFQRRLEHSAYNLAGSGGAPVQRLDDFIAGRITKSFGDVSPSFSPSYVKSDLNSCLPEFVSGGIKHALVDFGKKLRGFDSGDAVLTGVETRTSAPLRILRTENLQSVDVTGLYPAGEGAGYAGGIVSAAVDGIKCATALMSEFAKPT